MAKTFKKLQVFEKSSDFRKATKVVEVELTEPKSNEIRVKNIYAGCNATDINITAARYFTDGKIPFDIGLEALGVVDAIGSDVKDFQKGDPVLVLEEQPSHGFSEYLYVKSNELLKIPELKPEYLTVFVNGSTATIALDKAGHIKSGEKVLITAASGGTGQIAVQWAKQRGCYVIALTSNDTKAEYLKKLGADFIINYRKDDLDKVLTEKFPDGIDVIWETIGGKTFEILLNHLAVKGRMVVIGSITHYKDAGLSGDPIPDISRKLILGSKSLNGFMLFNYKEFIPEYLGNLVQQIAKNKIIAKVDLGESTADGKFFGVEQVWRAEEHLHGGKNIGKVIVQIQEP